MRKRRRTSRVRRQVHAPESDPKPHKYVKICRKTGKMIVQGFATREEAQAAMQQGMAEDLPLSEFLES